MADLPQTYGRGFNSLIEQWSVPEAKLCKHLTEASRHTQDCTRDLAFISIQLVDCCVFFAAGRDILLRRPGLGFYDEAAASACTIGVVIATLAVPAARRYVADGDPVDILVILVAAAQS